MQLPKKPIVAILMGSVSDGEQMRDVKTTLKEFGINSQMKVLSAHRTPDETAEFVMQAPAHGIEIIIAGAGGAAHLAGVVAAKTTLPVIGLPLQSKALRGLDSLLSTVQMPSGVPVATVGIDASRNAALLAVRILSLKYPALKSKLLEFSRNMRYKILESKVL